MALFSDAVLFIVVYLTLYVPNTHIYIYIIRSRVDIVFRVFFFNTRRLHNISKRDAFGITKSFRRMRFVVVIRSTMYATRVYRKLKRPRTIRNGKRIDRDNIIWYAYNKSNIIIIINFVRDPNRTSTRIVYNDSDNDFTTIGIVNKNACTTLI